MIKRIWSCDICHTIKSCVGVMLIGAAVAGMILIVRLVGERKLQCFLNFILFFNRRKPQLELASEALAPEKRI